ncbi:hypothetical protein Mapa_003811 [Marchantia paleacea]|nr:hypothetical protein Mapa_003811 [Marchantia paleacea]
MNSCPLYMQIKTECCVQQIDDDFCCLPPDSREIDINFLLHPIRLCFYFCARTSFQSFASSASADFRTIWFVSSFDS